MPQPPHNFNPQLSLSSFSEIAFLAFFIIISMPAGFKGRKDVTLQCDRLHNDHDEARENDMMINARVTRLQ